jgi:hypothetical protein
MTGTKPRDKTRDKTYRDKTPGIVPTTGTKPLKGFVPSGCPTENQPESRRLPGVFTAEFGEKAAGTKPRDKTSSVPFGVLSRFAPIGCGDPGGHPPGHVPGHDPGHVRGQADHAA